MTAIGDTVNSAFRSMGYKGDTKYVANQEMALYFLENSRITSFLSHGAYDSIILSNSDTLSVTALQSLSSGTLNDSFLVLYAGCSTGGSPANSTPELADNLVNVTYAQGANHVIGFKNPVIAFETYYWVQVFLTSLSHNNTINYALNFADQETEMLLHAIYDEMGPGFIGTTGSNNRLEKGDMDDYFY